MWGLAGQFVVHFVFSLLAIFQVWRPLSRPQADSVSLRFYDGRTQMEVAKEVGISQAQVSRLEKNAINQIKKNITA